MASGTLEEDGRTRKTARNALSGLLIQVIMVALGFVSRTIFIQTLGVEYLGLNSVFGSFLSLLSLADLGLGSAFAFALYSPLREKDWPRVASVLLMYRRVFRGVAVVVAVVGFLAAPVVVLVVDSSWPVGQLVGLYILCLASPVLSYLFADRVGVISADQRLYVVKWSNFVIDVARIAIQVVVLLSMQSFWAFLIVQLLATAARNLLIARTAQRLYPLAFIDPLQLPSSERAAIWSNVKGTAIYKFSGVFLNSIASVVISLLLGTAVVGYYANYALIIGSLVMLIDITFGAATASVGNLAAGKERESARLVFDEAVLASFVLHGATAVFLAVTLNDLIRVWLGDAFELGPGVVASMLLSFYVAGTIRPVAIFREAAGLFVRARFVLLSTALLNVFLAFVLGTWLGLAGVLLANPIARILAQAWIEPKILLNSYFGEGVRRYLMMQLQHLLLVAIAGGLAIGATWLIPTATLIGVLARGGVGLGVSLLVFGIALGRIEAAQRLAGRVRDLLG